MRNRLLALFAFISLAGCIIMTDSFASDGAQADPLLISAAENGDIAAVQKLIARDVLLDARDARGRTALLAATHANQIATARLLINAGADVNLADNEGNTPLQHARQRGYADIVNILEQADAE